MSYNISTCKIKKLENLIIPIKALYECTTVNKAESPVITNIETNEVKISCGCGQLIKGTISDGNLNVTSLDLSGEGSGTMMEDLFIPVLKKSTGKFEALLIWEGGDSVTKITVKDGEVTEEGVEL